MNESRSAIRIQAEARIDEIIRKRAEAGAKRRAVIVIGELGPTSSGKSANRSCRWPSGPGREMHICCPSPQDLACDADAA